MARLENSVAVLQILIWNELTRGEGYGYGIARSLKEGSSGACPFSSRACTRRLTGCPRTVCSLIAGLRPKMGTHARCIA